MGEAVFDIFLFRCGNSGLQSLSKQWSQESNSGLSDLTTDHIALAR